MGNVSPDIHDSHLSAANIQDSENVVFQVLTIHLDRPTSLFMRADVGDVSSIRAPLQTLNGCSLLDIGDGIGFAAGEVEKING